MKTIFEQNRNQEMKNSLYLEFHYSRKLSLDSMLMESKGNMNNVDEYLKTVMTEFRTQTNNGKVNKVIVVTEKEFSNVPNPIAKQFKVIIDYQNSDNENIYGVYNSKKSNLTNNVLDYVEIKVVAHGNYKSLLYELPRMLSHEFLHAYEKLMRLRKGNNRMESDAYTNNNIARQIANMTNDEVIKHISMIYYYCSSFERNAYTAQLNQQIIQYKDTIQDSETAYQVLQTTPLYQQYMAFGRTLLVLNKNKEQYKDSIEEWYELVYDGKHLSYGKIVRRLINLYNKTWRKIRKTTSSFLRQVYEDNDNVGGLYDNFQID